MEPVDEVLLASRALLGIVARSVAAALEQVSLPQFRLLVVLSSSGPLRQGALSARVGLSAPSTSRMVDRLEQQDLVRREKSTTSRREVLVRVTEAGAELVRGATAARRRALLEVLERLPAAEQEALVHAFAGFAAASGEVDMADLLLLGV